MTRLLLSTIALSCLLLLSAPSAKSSPDPKQMAVKMPLMLNVWPQRVSVVYHQPIYLRVALQNMTDQDRFVRFWFAPVPFGPKTDLHCLFMRCYDTRTNKKVRYTGFPPGETVDNAQGRESSEKVYAQAFVGYTVDLSLFCDLPPGDYSLVMQYDTRYVPCWMRSDKRAWHGATNKVTVSIHVAPAGAR